jgi:general transcription factor 3C polypeptide 3 (transcription factor C subunit 4)
MINLSIGLAYIHLALKRQTDNRQHNVLQGITFLSRYYESRKNSFRIEERHEAHFNMARAYHMLGLTHLAIPYYYKVFHKPSGEYSSPEREDLVLDTAYNLQTLYAIEGNPELAEDITRTWLVI